jgi:hypothetical protein
MTGLYATQVTRAKRERQCARCGTTIAARRWCAFVASTGWVHLRCLITAGPPGPAAPHDHDEHQAQEETTR